MTRSPPKISWASPSPDASPVASASPSAAVAQGPSNSNTALTPEQAQKQLEEAAKQKIVTLERDEKSGNWELILEVTGLPPAPALQTTMLDVPGATKKSAA